MVFPQTTQFPQTQSSQNVQASQSSQSPHSAHSYSNVAQADCFPKKEQAIILDVLDDTQLRDYSQALARVTHPSNIRFISRIANNRVCAYVATKELADELVDIHKVVSIKGIKVQIRPLITRNKRIILSNVCPVIPHYVLLDKLTELNVTPTSPITFLRAGLTEPGFNHILSFRRQLYVAPDDVSKIPERLQISFEDTNYWIYLSTDTMSCFLCKQEGHIAKLCPNADKSNNLNELLNSQISEKKMMPPPSTPVSKSPSLEVSPDVTMDYESQNLKRSRPESSASSAAQAEPLGPKSLLDDLEDSDSGASIASNQSIGKTRQLKKSKLAEFPLNLIDWTQIEKAMEGKSFPMDTLQFKNFIESTFGKSNVKEIAEQYVKNTQELINMIKELHPIVTGRVIKGRLTRIRNKLESKED